MTKTEQELEKIALPVVEELGYELYDIEFVKEGSDWFLRLYIDQNNHTIDLEDCEKVSDAMSAKLDEVDPIQQSYHLEVSSCGLERHLREEKHFLWARGKKISVTLYQSVEGAKQWEGTLKQVEDGKLLIQTEEKEVEVKRDNIASAKILYDWEESKHE